MLPFLKEVATDLVNRYGDSLKDIAIIFNNKRPEVYMKQYFVEIVKKPIWSPSFFTIQDFFKQASIAIEIDKIGQIAHLHECYTRLLLTNDQEPLSIDRFFPIAETILSDFAQIDYELIDPSAIYQEIHDLAAIEKQFQFLTKEQIAFLEAFWKSFSQYGQEQIREKFIALWKMMPQLYTDFKHTLEKLGKSTTSAMYREAAINTRTDSMLTGPYKQLVFVGFNALNRAEGTLFKRWQEQGKALFYFDADQYYLEDKMQEAGLFIRKNIEQWRLENALGPFPDTLRRKTDRITVFEASGFTAQAKILHTLLAKKKKETPIAVLLADENLLIPTLQSIPETLLTNITMGFPINQSPIFGLVEIWLRIQTNYYTTNTYTIPYKDLESYLAHPLINTLPSEKKEIQQTIKDNNYLDVPYAALAHYNEINVFFKREKHAIPLITALEVILKRIFNYRKDHGNLTLIEASLFTTALQELNHLYDGLHVYSSLQQAALPFTISLVRKHLYNINAAIEGDPLKGVQIMGMLESRNLDFKEIYILGANDGILPKKSFGNTFIPDAIRRAYGLPVLENQEALSAYLFYRLLQRSEQITIVYNNQVDENSTGEVSRFIKQLAFESNFSFSQLKQQQETNISKLPLPLHITKTGKVAETLDNYLTVDPLKISATALTNYIQSPLLFFFKNIAKIKEPDQLMDDFQVNKIGSVLHEVMQWFYEDLKSTNATITANRIHEKCSELPTLCLQALSNTFYKNKTYLSLEKTTSIEKIILQIVEDYARIILNIDIGTCPFNIIELENNEDYVIDFLITVNGQEKLVKLQGIIDRIDEKDGKIRIVDYKTGGDVLEYTKNNDELFNASNPKFNKALIQTLFYTYIYEQKKGIEDVEPHLYAVRRLNNEGSFFHSDNQALVGDRLKEIKAVFLSKLRETLEELFNKEIPFMHNPSVILPYNELYEEFFRSSSSDHKT
ncbi:PD-(D/E)XK nuclease family protein [Olivibacter sp. SDN3]|uniref:PD-(D/E)XK nuclease family protein n=1 Tax=Olivibacter sp. SDN3 TaxID=2764720 RepID=UPI001650DD56|nr:PD-(D/E)XK nuclease family protein [Olivibacter sp. SDN3]QNL51126.1 PD-(D/E)XK nuclease family protein [Olivibacter sp. SDN3]